MPKAARAFDLISCPMQTPTPGGPVPHCPGPGMPITSPGQPLVLINNFPAATVGDQSQCASPAGPLPNPVIAGALMVLVGNKPAARETDVAAHPGSKIFNGSVDVEIGGPSTIGNVPLAMDDCQKLGEGRTSQSLGQSYGNCGVESCRSIVNRVNNSSVSEDAMLNKALADGYASPGSTPNTTGGTYPVQQMQILESYGVDAVTSAPSLGTITEHLAARRGVIANIWAARTWPSADVVASGAVPGDPALAHAVRVTGVTLDSAGNPDTVYLLDTSGVDGGCAYAVPAAVFEWAMIGGREVVVTENPIW